MALTQAQRETLAGAHEAAVMAISLGGDQFIEIMITAIHNSTLSDDEIETLGNRIGRIPQERMRTWHSLYSAS